MSNYNPYMGEGDFYKGCLHCHTTASDGVLAPEEVVNLYRKKGYGFLAITDHQYFTDITTLNDDCFVLIAGIEYCMKKTDQLKTFHFLGLRASDDVHPENISHGESLERPDWVQVDTPQKMIDFLREKNNHVVLSHTVWSRTDPEDFRNLEGYFAMEIYTHLAEINKHMGLSTVHWDSVLRSGKKVYGIAVDDAHHKKEDRGGGWVMVKSKALKGKDIMNSLLAGRFYSSTGPEIKRFEIIDDEVHIECSPVNSIHFMADEPRGDSYYAAKGGNISCARYKLSGKERYVRVECIDLFGKTAWTNPIFFK